MIDNEFYKNLGDKWHTSKGDAVALLRLEGLVKTPWVLKKMSRVPAGSRVLDIGCGGGDLVLELSRRGYLACGLDTDDAILAVGRNRGSRAEWIKGTAENLPFEDRSFDAICVMDVLEHVADPRQVLAEAVRVLKPGGLFLFHTFNRTPLAWLFAAKGLDWFIKNSPKNIHDWKMFIKPVEIETWLRELGMTDVEFTGIGPNLRSKAFAKLVFTRTVSENFEFKMVKSLAVGYLGSAMKK